MSIVISFLTIFSILIGVFSLMVLIWWCAELVEERFGTWPAAFFVLVGSSLLLTFVAVFGGHKP